MSELDYDLGDEGLEEEFVEPAFDIGQLEGTTPAPGASVTSRFFHPDGSVKESPELQSEGALIASYEAQARGWEAEEAAQGPSALEAYDEGPASEEVAYQDYVAVVQAQQEAYAQSYARSFVDAATELGRGLGVTDPELLEQAASYAQQQVADWWRGELGRGASVRQRDETMASPAFSAWVDERLGEALEAARYLNVTRNTRMRRDADRWWEEDSSRAEFLNGPAAKTTVERYPSLQRMAERMSARSQRQAERQEQLREIAATNQYWHDVNRAQYEAARPRTRKLGS